MEESKPAKTDREVWAWIEIPTQWKPVEVPSGAAQGNDPTWLDSVV